MLDVQAPKICASVQYAASRPSILADEIGKPPKRELRESEVEIRIAIDERHGTRAA